MMRRWTVVPTLLLILLAACQTTPPEPPTTLSPTDTRQPLPTPTATPVKLESPTPSAPTPTATPVKPKSPADMAVWNFVDLRDSQVNDVVARQGETYAVDPNWKVKSIHYLYKWWGLGKPVFDYQVIEREGDRFKRGTEVVTADKVQTFLKSLNALYPSQMLLGGNAWTDDYPSWAIEIVGEDGRRVQLFSSSTGNAGDGPWNVLDNGRLYAQYDGSLAVPLSKLFISKRGEPAATYMPGGRQLNSIVFGTEGFPGQMLYGFNGLLPIADGFGYTTNVMSGTLEGFVQGRRSVAGTGMMVIGSITGLTRVELTAPSGTSVPCTIDPITLDDPASAVWKFVCTPGGARLDQPYRFSITIELGTDKEEHFTTTGEVWGKWEARLDGPYSPPSLEVQRALEADGIARDLLKDHFPVMVLYQAEISATTPLSGTIMGEVVLAGSTAANGVPLRYTIGTPFVIKDGQLTHWTLPRDALDHLLHDVTALTLTQRILNAAPSTQLNLWYAEKSSDLPGHGEAHWYNTTMLACGKVREQEIPREGVPFRAFGFNNDWSPIWADFVLIDDKPVVYNLSLWPLSNDERSEIWPLLLPAMLDTGDYTPFDSVDVQAGISYKDDVLPTLTLNFSEDATPADRAKYHQIAALLPGARETLYNIEAKNVTLVVNNAGELEVAACDPAERIGPRPETRYLTKAWPTSNWSRDTGVRWKMLPLEVSSAFATNDVTADLLNDHVVGMLRYWRQDDGSDPDTAEWGGEIVLLGEMSIGDTRMRYTIGTPFEIKNGRVQTWSLTRQALNDMIRDIGQLPLTRRIIKAEPESVLNMWYTTHSSWSLDYEILLHACGTSKSQRFPSSGNPLRAFSFDAGWNFEQPDFVLMDGKAVVYQLDIAPNQDGRGKVSSLLLPAELDTGQQLPFDRIWLALSWWGDDPLTLELWLSPNAQPADLNKYAEIAASLPVTVTKEKRIIYHYSQNQVITETFDGRWKAAGVTFVVNEQGELEIAACQP